jgi:hypothetical protein
MAIAFKEWALVCDALGRGEQSLLLRKGGIAEGVSGFGFEHSDFFLFPTWFHAQAEKVKGEHLVLPEQDPENVTITYTATIEWSGRVNDKEAVHRLSELHVLDASVIEDRFAYSQGKGGISGTSCRLCADLSTGASGQSADGESFWRMPFLDRAPGNQTRGPGFCSQ